MRKYKGTISQRDKYPTLAAISPPGVARRRFVGGHRSGLAWSKSHPLFKRGPSSRPSQGRRQGDTGRASPRASAPIFLPLLGGPGSQTLEQRGMAVALVETVVVAAAGSSKTVVSEVVVGEEVVVAIEITGTAAAASQNRVERTPQTLGE